MRAVRKLDREPGLVLDEVPVPDPRGRRGAGAGRGGERLRHRPAHPSLGRVGGGPRHAAADARARALRHRRRAGARRHRRRGGRLRVGGEPRHVRTLLPLPDRARAHVREHADPRRRPGRRVRATTSRSPRRWSGSTTARSSRRRSRRLQEPFGNAVFATSTQELAGRTVAVLGCGPVGLFTVAIARAFGARASAREPTTSPSGSTSREQIGADAVANVDEIGDTAGWFHERNEGERPRRRPRDVGRARRDRTTRSAIAGTAATSCSSGSPPSRSRSTSPSR